MQINGLSAVHGPQALRGAQFQPRTPQTPETSNVRLHVVDEVEISAEAQFISKARDLPEIRFDKVAELQAAIARGDYETPDKLDVALDRLLDEIA